LPGRWDERLLAHAIYMAGSVGGLLLIDAIDASRRWYRTGFPGYNPETFEASD
jgi:hypothetical protein